MNKLEWRLAFAKQYAKRRGDFLMGWILSKTEVRKARLKKNIFQGIIDQFGGIAIRNDEATRAAIAKIAQFQINSEFRSEKDQLRLELGKWPGHDGFGPHF